MCVQPTFLKHLFILFISSLGFCLRHCATSWKVAGSIPDGVIGIFHWHIPFGHTMALGEVDSDSNRNEYQEYLLGVKAAGAYGWQPYHLHVPIVLKSGSFNFLEPSGPVQACNGISFPFNNIPSGKAPLRWIRRGTDSFESPPFKVKFFPSTLWRYKGE